MAAPSLVLLLLGASAPAGSAAEPPAYDPSRVRWQALSYRVSKFGFAVDSEVELRSGGDGEQGEAATPSESEPALPVSGSETLLLSLETRAFQRRSDLRLWLDSRTAAARRRVQIETGNRLKRNRFRELRFEREGFHSRLRRPADNEIGMPPATWSRSRESFSRYPHGCCEAVSTPAALFYIFSVAELARPGDRIELHLVSKSRLFRVELVAIGESRLQSDFVEQSAAGEKRITGSREILEITLRGREVGPGEQEQGFEFLGLRGDVRLALDRQLGVPLEISGAIRYVGRGRVRLRRIVSR